MNQDLILQVRNLKTYFPILRSFVAVLQRKPQEYIKAVDGVSFELASGEVLAIVGESGCGKTTIARTLIGLETKTAGEVHFEGKPVRMVHGRTAKGYQVSLGQLRQKAQMVFQDPYESLNPRSSIGEIVGEPLLVHGITRNRPEQLARVRSVLEDVGLRPADDYLLRYPHELSGGQRQRVVIAAAMVLRPRLLIADEPVSMLDVSIRAEILNLLNDLRRERGVSILFITHDLSTVAYFADRIAVMYLGRIVEMGSVHEVLSSPRHPYTQALISVVPVPNPRQRKEHTILQGETPNPINLPSGCRFHPRCPVAFEKCKNFDPPEVEVGPSHFAACLLLK